MMKSACSLVVLCLLISLASAQTRRFTVQISSHAYLDEALNRVSELRTHGVEAYYLKSTVPGRGIFYRVRVGRFGTVSAARLTARELMRAGLIGEHFITTEDLPDTGIISVEKLGHFQVVPDKTVIRARRAFVAALRPNGIFPAGTSPAARVPPSSGSRDYPRAEFFAGYSYLRADREGQPPQVRGGDFHGWNVSIAGNPTRWLGLVFDASGHYGSYRITGIPGAPAKVDFRVHSFLFGPRLNYRGARFTPFVHTLFGAARGDASASVVGFRSTDEDTAFAMALGGGLDVKATDRISIRLFQTEYLQTNFGDEKQHNFRFSTGLVFK
jgi:opacity protein-like surface antigen